MSIAMNFLNHLLAALPYKIHGVLIHGVLTDNGIQFTHRL